MFDPSTLPLHDYQKYSVEFIKTHPKCGLFLPMGSGKSLITLSAIFDLNPNGHILVVAPKNIARSVWLDEIKKWKIPIRTKSFIVESDPKSKRYGKKLTRASRLKKYAEVVTDPPTMYFINRELLRDLINNMPVQNGRPVWYFPTVIADEAQSFKSAASDRFKAMKYVSPCIERFIELTGTPTPQGLIDLWSEIYLLDGGARLGKTITEYKNRFFHPTLYVQNRPVKWEPNYGAEDEIYQLISDIVVSVKNPNIQLPPVTYTDFTVHLDPEENTVYRLFAKKSVLETPDWKVVAVNNAVLANKLSQLASGAIYTAIPDQNENNDADTADDTVESQNPIEIQELKKLNLSPPVNKPNVREYQVIHEKKLEACEFIMEQSDGPILIAYNFQSDREMLKDRFPTAKVFDGDPKTIQAWNNQEIPILLIQPASAGHGLNLQNGGHTLIWYTIPTNLEHYLQTNARLYRQGQKNPVMIYHLLTSGTIDHHNLHLLTTKDAAEQRLIDAVQAAVDDL